jgi:hypothetical protein
MFLFIFEDFLTAAFLYGIGWFLKFLLIVGVRESDCERLYGLRITHQLFKSYVFTGVRSQSTGQRLLRGEI